MCVRAEHPPRNPSATQVPAPTIAPSATTQAPEPVAPPDAPARAAAAP